MTPDEPTEEHEIIFGDAEPDDAVDAEDDERPVPD